MIERDCGFITNVDKQKAIAMRRRGKSYRYISAKLLISKGTLSEWFKKFKWSKNIKTRLSKEAEKDTLKRSAQFVANNQKRWHAWRESHCLEAMEEFEKIKNNQLFIAGTMLYWAEGDNGEKSSIVRLTNTDPRMIRTFIYFAIRFCKVRRESIRVGLILYPDLNETVCKSFWSKQVDVPLEQFYKVQFIKGHHPTKRLDNGICSVIVGGRGLKEKIRTWIDLNAKNFIAGIV